MSPKFFLALPAMLLALSAVPTLALDISAGGSASGGTGDSGLSAGFGTSASASVQAGGGSDDDGAKRSASASGSASGTASIELDRNDPLLDVILLIRGNNWTKSSLSGLTEFKGKTYDADAWLNSENSAAFEQALKAHADDIADLRYSIAANADFTAWLDSENADASAVVAVGLSADGSLAVFVHR